MDIPAPTPLKKLITSSDYEGCEWMLVDVDTSRLFINPIRINISLPENLVQSIDRYPRSQHLILSGFLAKVALEEIQKNA